MGENLHDLGFGCGFLNMSNEWKIGLAKVFCWSKDIIDKVKSQFAEWEKYLEIMSLIRV